MISARTAKVLISLLVAMTLGAGLLMLMETDPILPGPADLATIRGQVQDRTWDIRHPWRRIIVHSSNGAPDVLPRRCHFLIEANPGPGGRQWVSATKHWKDQTPGCHTFVAGHDFNADSIAICVMGDFSSVAPSQGQFDALMVLVRELQKQCNIPADSVYLQSEINPARKIPGEAFPAVEFNRRLYRPYE